MEKLIITAAISGAEVTKEHNPAVPYTVEEIGREAESAYKAGASIIHLHVREDDGTPTQAKERFKIKNLDSANWAFRKLAAINEKEKEIRELTNKEIKRIQDWAKEDLDKLNDSKEFFNYLLEEHYREQRAIDPKYKLSTPYGKVTSRKQQPEWIYDNEKVVEWLLKNDKDLVRVKYEPSKTDIKKKYQITGSNVVTEDGEIVDGITVEEREDSISVKVVE